VAASLRVRPIARRLASHPVLGAILLVVMSWSAMGCDRSAALREADLEGSTAVGFEAPGGIELEGRVFGPDTARAGIVLSHMLPADQTSWFSFASELAGEGYRVLTFNFRGYCPGGQGGCSGGSKDVTATPADLGAAIAYLAGTGVQEVGLVGASMGGTASLLEAADRPRLIPVAIALSAPQEIEGLVVGPDTLQATPAAKLFVAGSFDTMAADAAARMFQESGQPKRLEVVPTDDHGTDLLDGSQGPALRSLLTTYLAQYLPPAQTGEGPA
jgi:pimeloyl-ACP methyl ester carboxylesterase